MPKIIMVSRYTNFLDRPFLRGMGSTGDLFGLSFDPEIPDLSKGFQRDAEAIWNDFCSVGTDIWKPIEEFRTPSSGSDKE